MDSPLANSANSHSANVRINTFLAYFNDFELGTSSVGCSRLMIVYSIFALYRDTENIHSIMMIWLVIFIISNYSLASSPPKDPGGVKKTYFQNQRTLIHRIFSVNQNYQTRFQKSGICIFILCALSATRNCVFSCQKEKKKLG